MTRDSRKLRLSLLLLVCFATTGAAADAAGERLPIAVEGIDETSPPKAEDFRVFLGPSLVPVVDVEAARDAPVLVVLLENWPATRDEAAARRFLARAATQLERARRSSLLVLLRHREAGFGGPISGRAELAVLLREPGTPRVEEDPEGDPKAEGPDAFWTTADRLRSLIESISADHPDLHLVLLARDAPPPPGDEGIGESVLQGLTASLRKVGNPPLFLGVPEERGVLTRLTRDSAGRIVDTNYDGLDLARLLDEERSRTLLLRLDTAGLAPQPAPRSLRVEVTGPPDVKLTVTRHPPVAWFPPRRFSPPTYEALRLALDLRRERAGLFVEERWMDALVSALRIVELSPFTLEDRLALIELYGTIDHLERAREVALEGLDLFSDSWRLHVWMGELSEREGNPEAAVQWYDKGLRLDPEQPITRLRLARAYLELGRDEAARIHLERLRDTPLDGARVRLDLAGIHYRTGDGESAEREAQDVLATAPDYPDALRLLCSLYLDLRRYDSAYDRATRLLEIDPSDPAGARAAGISLAYLERFSEALPHLEKALSQSAEDIEVNYALYRTHHGLDHEKAAIEYLTRAKDLAPSRAHLYMELAELLTRSGDFRQAGEVLREGAASAGDSFELFHRLGLWLERRGELREALFAYREAAKRASPEDRAGVVKTLLLLGTLTDTPLDDETTRALEELNLPRPASASEADGRRPAASDAVVEAPLTLPGGLSPLLRFAPFLEMRTSDEDLVAVLFAYVLAGKSLSTLVNERRDQLVEFYRRYSDFKGWLREKRLFAPELELRFSTQPADVRRANQILSYFGAQVRVGKRKGAPPTLELREKKRQVEQRAFLNELGLNVGLIRADTSATLAFHDEIVPVMFGMDYWYREILGGRGRPDEEALMRWLDRPDAMKLYVALAELPEAAAQWFRKTFSAKELLEEIAPGLAAFGSLLKFHDDGGLALPGDETGKRLWEGLVGVPRAEGDRFIRRLFSKDRGRALYYLGVLSQASPEVTRYFTSSRSRFERVYQQVEEVGDLYRRGVAHRKYHDFGDLLLLLESDGENLYFPGTERMWAVAARGSSGSRGLSRLDRLMRRKIAVLDDEQLLVDLLRRTRGGASLEAAQKYAVLKYLEELRPALMDERTTLALELSFSRFAGQFSLISDLYLDTEGLLEFLRQVEEYDRAGGAPEHRTVSLRLFQGGLALLQNLANRGVFSPGESRDLATEFLKLQLHRLRIEDQTRAVLGFLDNTLFPSIASRIGIPHSNRNGTEVLLRGLAGVWEPVAVRWEDRTLRIDLSEREIRRMEALLDFQDLPSLDGLMAIFSALEGLREDREESLATIRGACFDLSEPRMDRGTSGAYRRAVVSTNLAKLREACLRLERTVKRERRRDVEKHAGQMMAELAPFVAESLVGLVYAGEVDERDVVTNSDEHFVRKHEFGAREFSLGWRRPVPEGGTWGQPRVVSDAALGGRLQGSLIDISTALAALSGEQISGGLATRFADTSFPVAQKVALALVNPERLTDEAVAYAAFAMDFGERILAAALYESRVREYVDGFVFRYCGARRVERVRERLDAGNPAGAAAELLPSELLFLAEEYLEHFEDEPPALPGVSAFRRMADGKDADALAQLGFPVGSWYGVEVLKLEPSASIESMTAYMGPYRLGERTCELKLHLARLFWRTGLPAPLLKPVGNRVLDRVMERVGQSDRRDWRPVISAIRSVDEGMIGEAIAEIAAPFD